MAKNFDNQNAMIHMKEAGLFLGVVLCCILLIFRGMMPAIALIPGFAVGVWLIGRKDVTFMLACFATLSSFRIPFGFISAAPLGLIFMLAFVLTAVFEKVLRRRDVRIPVQERTPLENIFLKIFLANLLLTIAFRGFGLVALGSGNMIGGKVYIQIIAAILFYLCSGNIRFSLAQSKGLFVLVFFSVLLPFSAQYITVLSEGKITFLSDFFVFSMTRVIDALAEGSEGGRYETTILIAYVLMIMGFVGGSFRRKKVNYLLVFLTSSIAMAIILYSGFRRYVPLFLFSYVGVAFFVSKQRNMFVALYGLFAVMFYIVLYFIAEDLPFNLRRALAVVPGLPVGEEVVLNSISSNEWRMRMMDHCLSEVPNYLLIGKGLLLSFEETVLLYSAVSTRNLDHSFAIHSYHSGVFELLLDLGLVGFLSFMGFVSTLLVKNLRLLLKTKKRDHFYYIVVAGLLVLIGSRVAAYLVSQGGLKTWFLELMVFSTLLNVYGLALREKDQTTITRDESEVLPLVEGNDEEARNG